MYVSKDKYEVAGIEALHPYSAPSLRVHPAVRRSVLCTSGGGSSDYDPSSEMEGEDF